MSDYDDGHPGDHVVDIHRIALVCARPVSLRLIIHLAAS